MLASCPSAQHSEEASRSKASSNAHNASKYDFVKVKVWLGDGASHYYILSRFLISRMLTVTKIPYIQAVKISLELKKHLIDSGQFEVSQATLEKTLFSVMDNRGFGADFITRYKMVNQFHQERRPLIVIICGAPCTGKSSLAQQLASRFNMPNVVNTDLFHELLRIREDIPMHRQSLWQRSDLKDDQLLAEYQKECQIVRRSIDGDLVKTIRDGKSIIIEGLHLDPGLYLEEFGRYGIRHLHRADSLLPNQASSAAHEEEAVLLEPVNPEPLSADQSVQQAAALEPGQALPQDSREQTNQKPPEGRHGTQQSASSNLVTSTRQMLHTQLSQETVPGTRLLFALASVADKLSPVLSSRVSSFSRATQQKDGAMSKQQTQSGQPPESDWFTQQLRKAYHGLADTCKPANAAQRSDPPENQAGSAVLEHADPQQLAADQGQEQSAKCQQEACCEGMQQQTGSKPSEHQQHSHERSQHQQSGHETSQYQHNRHEHCHCQETTDQQMQPQPAAHAGNQDPEWQREPAGAEARDSNDVQDRVPTAVALEPDQRHTEGSRNMTHAHHSGQDNQNEAKGELDTPKVDEKQKHHQTAATPIFVPIVVAMDDQDHHVLVAEWFSRQMALSGQMNDADISDQDMTATADATYRRLRLLQDHLCSYSKTGVPVVTLDFANFSDTMEQLHDYLLQCIESAMRQQ